MLANALRRSHPRLALIHRHLHSFSASTPSCDETETTPQTIEPPADSRNRHSWSFITASAFHGKPKSPRDPPLDPAASIPPDSPIQQWHDNILRDHVSSGGGKVLGGHDWWFIQPMKEEQSVALGVADGVGGWSEEGVDPGSVAKGLMYFSHQLAQQGYASEQCLPDDDDQVIPQPSLTSTRTNSKVLLPHHILSKAWSNVISCNDVHGGATTALISTLCSKTGLLRYASLGDSQLSIIRRSTVVHQSQLQTHFFNCPYQLTKFPPSHQKSRQRQKKSNEIEDEPSQASLGQWQCQDGDVVILWTDGVGDNVFPREVEQVFTSVMDQEENEHLSESVKIEKFALMMCYLTRLKASSTKSYTPFSMEAKEHGYYDMEGGKLDDITVVVALCREH